VKAGGPSDAEPVRHPDPHPDPDPEMAPDHGRSPLPGPGTMARSDFVTRPATHDDLPAILTTENDSFSTPWSRRAFEALLGRSTVSFQVLEARGEVAGHGVLWWVGPEAEVANLAVAPAFRSRGGGARLLDALLAAAAVRGVETVFLEVRESNGGARALYERRGFIAVGRRPQYYRKPPEDAVIMALDLAGDHEPASRPMSPLPRTSSPRQASPPSPSPILPTPTPDPAPDE
jgi:[ribosomal protein S18]-alanine N-acetyltransferase